MVLHDPHHSTQQKKESLLRAPTTSDRLAAAFIDFLCFFFLIFIVLAPLRREMAMARLTEAEGNFALTYSLSLFLFLLVCALYQSFFVAWRGATPGMKFLKMSVVNVWTEEKPSFVSSLIRGFAWTLSFALCFIPHLGVLTNEKRRAFHDRLADTEMISLNGRFATPPTPFIKFVMRGFAVGVTAALLIIATSEITRFSKMTTHLKDWRQELLDVSPQSCHEVEEAEDSWETEFHDQAPSRLSLALALYSANTLEDECLATEALRAFQNGEELELAYLAKSFYHSENAELSDMYLQKVCELSKTSNACQFSKMIEMWAEEKTAEADGAYQAFLVKGPLYGKIWAIKHFERIKDFQSELTLIEKLWPQKSLANFLGAHRSVALWGLHRRDEARTALVSTIENMVPSERVELASWFCYRELADSCDSIQEPSCKAFLEFAGADSARLPAANLLVSYMRIQECSKEGYDFQDLMAKASGDSSFTFLNALENVYTGDRKLGLDVLRPIASDLAWDKSFREEAARQVILQSRTSEEFETLISEWKEGEQISWEWRNEGIQLLKRLRELKLYKMALNVGQVLMIHKALDTETKQHLAILAYTEGFKKQALSFLNVKSDRTPANENQPDPLLKKQNLDEQYYHVRESLLREMQEGFSQ
ncbi:MAG: RDD family protein [Bdellovibrionales bacterium]